MLRAMQIADRSGIVTRPFKWGVALLLAAAHLAVACGSDESPANTGGAGSGGEAGAAGSGGMGGSGGGGVDGPITGRCDDSDPVRCFLPWPSSRFLIADETSPTGVRVEIDPDELVFDDPAGLVGATGFSTVSPLLVGVPGSIQGAPTDQLIRLFVMEADHEAFGSEVPLRTDVTDDGQDQVVIAYPRRPMVPAAQHIAVAFASGDLVPSRQARIRAGLVEPETDDERAWAAYFESARATLIDQGIDLSGVARIWDFTTRDRDQALARTRAMRAAAVERVEDGAVTVVIDSLERNPRAGIQLILNGRLRGLPDYPDSYQLGVEPESIGDRDAPFRLMIPDGTGDYPVALYGHGLGGSYDEDTFEDLFARAGVAKLGVSFYGLGADAPTTLLRLVKPLSGSNHVVALQQQAVADIAGLTRSLTGALADAASAPRINGQPNPAAGRRPSAAPPLWIGGSLGGTMGLTVVSADPLVRFGVLNVPGAAWTHFSAYSQPFDILAGILEVNLGTALDVRLVTAMAQNVWDPIDGAVWAGAEPGPADVFLIQESMGDPILPNIGSDITATSTGAVHIGAVLEAIVGVEPVAGPADATAITQFKVASTDELDIHGFGAGESPAGVAAREQIEHFIMTALTGQPEIIVPQSCLMQSCDFSQ